LAATTVADGQPLTPSYPLWLKNAHGYMGLGLQNYTGYTPANIYKDLINRWNNWKDVMPWFQFWGQMVGESVNECCTGYKTIHARYLTPFSGDTSYPALPQGMISLVNYFKTSPNARVGFYSRPPNIGDPDPVDIIGPYRLTDTDGKANLGGQTPIQFFQDWTIGHHQNLYGANAFYNDILGCLYYGETLPVINIMLANGIARDMLSECLHDVLPYPGMASGLNLAYGMAGAGKMNGGPAKTPHNTTAAETFHMFSPLSAYLLDDRIIFMGLTNHGGLAYGTTTTNRFSTASRADPAGYCTNNPTDISCQYCFQDPSGSRCDHWMEREVFLLGFKFDAGSGANPLVRLAIEKRNLSGWWSKNPKYRDVKGLTNISPNDVFVRRFAAGSQTLLTVDNWLERASFSVTTDGVPRTFTIPTDPLTNKPSKLTICDTTSGTCY
jgi:hypothetical protein